MKALPLLLLTVLSVAQAASNPAPLNGIWTLTGVSEAAPKNPAFAPKSAGELVIVNGQLSGNYGCGRFQGTLNAAHNAAKISAEALPPRATERCVFAVHNPALSGLNAAEQYTVSQNYLVVFSKAARLTYRRVGYVTPANK
jgi:META domain